MPKTATPRTPRSAGLGSLAPAYSPGLPTIPYREGMHYEPNPNAALKEFVFNNLNPKPTDTQPRDLGWGNNIVQAGLNFYNDRTDRSKLPTNKRIFLESVVDKKKAPITERDFTPEELAVMKQLALDRYKDLEPYLSRTEAKLIKELSPENIMTEAHRYGYDPETVKAMQDRLAAIQAYRRGIITQPFLDIAKTYSVKPAVSYDSYTTNDEDAQTGRTVLGTPSPRESVSTTLGQYSYEIDPKTNELVAVDKYDFNGGSEGTTPDVIADNAAFGPYGAYQIIRAYAGDVMPPGKGRDVRVRLPNADTKKAAGGSVTMPNNYRAGGRVRVI